jgi:Protein of unknown function (DUF3106)
MAERRSGLLLCCALLLAAAAGWAEPAGRHQRVREHGAHADWLARNEDRGGQPRHASSPQSRQSRDSQDFGPEDRRRLQEREQGFRALPDAEQQRLRQTEERYRSMPPEQREELRRRWEGMSESERDRYRRRVENRGR